MIVTLVSTEKVVEINGVPARIWEGTTSSGIKCHAFITRIAVSKDQDTTQFERELQQQSAPSAAIDSYPLKMIL